MRSDAYQEVIQKMTTTKKARCESDCACADDSTELKLKFSQADVVGTVQPPSNEVKKEEAGCCF